MVGAAFSLGFLFGPSIGAGFSIMGHGNEGSFLAFQYPALFALTLTLINIGLVAGLLSETLPPEQRVLPYTVHLGHLIRGRQYHTLCVMVSPSLGHLIRGRHHGSTLSCQPSLSIQV